MKFKMILISLIISFLTAEMLARQGKSNEDSDKEEKKEKNFKMKKINSDDNQEASRDEFLKRNNEIVCCQKHSGEILLVKRKICKYQGLEVSLYLCTSEDKNHSTERERKRVKLTE
mmetsp:Transcript_29020/g.30153  ORF Transcript_29020/g.30153 Transcript_29020/m.30153 type:complete len:116 (+) Transcript_29020:19-366(+)